MTRRALGAVLLAGAALATAAPAAQAQYCDRFGCPGLRQACQLVGGCPVETADCYGSPEVRFCVPPRNPA